MSVDKSNSLASTISNGSTIQVLIDYSLSQITPYVFVTAGDTAQRSPTIYSNGIGCVINVADELPQMLFPPETGIESIKYPIYDIPTFPIYQYFDSVADRIATNVASNRRTLLYCNHGRSRSITMILAYLIKHHRLPLPTAYALVRDKRQIALPNAGFWAQLMAYELYQQQQQYNNTPRLAISYSQVQHPQQQQVVSAIPMVRSVQDSVSYGQQVLTKLSTGFEEVLSHDPFVTALVEPKMLPHSRPVYYRVIRRRPTIFPSPYHFRLPQGIYVKRLF